MMNNKTRPFLHINLLIKYSVQQQIHFNGNVFENKWCRCNEGWVYKQVVNGKYKLCKIRRDGVQYTHVNYDICYQAYLALR